MLGWLRGRKNGEPEIAPREDSDRVADHLEPVVSVVPPTAPAVVAADLRQHGVFETGRAYVVTRAFADYDGLLHDVGEAFTVASMTFDTAEDCLTLHVQHPDKAEAALRLQDRPMFEGPVIANLDGYFAIT